MDNTRFRAWLRAELRPLVDCWPQMWRYLRHGDAEANSNALESDWEKLRCG